MRYFIYMKFKPLKVLLLSCFFTQATGAGPAGKFACTDTVYILHFPTPSPPLSPHSKSSLKQPLNKYEFVKQQPVPISLCHPFSCCLPLSPPKPNRTGKHSTCIENKHMDHSQQQSWIWHALFTKLIRNRAGKRRQRRELELYFHQEKKNYMYNVLGLFKLKSSVLLPSKPTFGVPAHI